VQHAWNRKKSYKALVENLEGKRPLGRYRHRWEANVKMDSREMRCGELWTEFNWLRIETSGVLFGHGNNI
jgi:hypothetical protein